MKGRTMDRFQDLLSSTVGHSLPRGLGGAPRLCGLRTSPAGGTPFRGDCDTPDPWVAALGEDPFWGGLPTSGGHPGGPV